MNIRQNVIKDIKNLRQYEFFPEVPDIVHSVVLNTLENVESSNVHKGDTSARQNKRFRYTAAIVAAVGIFAIVSITGFAAYKQMTALQIQQFVATLTSENIEEYLELDESSVRISAPDENGMYKLTWQNGESYENLDSYDLIVGELFVTGYGFNDAGFEYVKRLEYVKTITLNEDGTVTLAVYVPRQH